MAEQFLTVEQTAARLHVHPITVRRQLRSGALRGFKRGNLWRVPESALVDTTMPSVSPLVRAFAMIKERDERVGPVAARRDGDTASDVRAVREAETP